MTKPPAKKDTDSSPKGEEPETDRRGQQNLSERKSATLEHPAAKFAAPGGTDDASETPAKTRRDRRVSASHSYGDTPRPTDDEDAEPDDNEESSKEQAVAIAGDEVLDLSAEELTDD
jgi:hypothetical protein